MPQGITFNAVRCYSAYGGDRTNEIQSNPFTLPNTTKYIHLLFNGENLTDESITLMKNANIKLEQGSTATPYSPYGMGSINEKIQNKNWNTSTLESGGLTNGLPNTNYTTCRTKDFIDIKPNTNFAFSINGTLNRVVVSMYDKDKNFIATAGGNGYVAVNGLFTTYANAYYIKYRAYNDDKQLFLNGNIQLEEGSTATPYVPHEEQDYSIPVQQPMRSIGDVRDCFVKKSDGWYERHFIGEVVLNGTESWKLLNSTSDYYEFITYNSLKPVAPSSYTFPMASHFGNATNNRCVVNENQLLIRVPASMNITNATEFKNWLQENNVTINYLLAEPLDLPCTEEQIEVLENKPSTYKDFTIIQSEDETEAYLEVSGINDGLDGTGSGDMLKSDYDTNNNCIVDNSEKVNGHTVESDVPANAKFTDTTYANATQESDGIMSKEDKQKLDSLSNYDDTTIKEEINTKANATDVYVKAEIDTKVENLNTSKQDTLTSGNNITIENNIISAKNTTYTNATSKSDGLMSKEDKSKIDNILKLVYPVGAIYISVNSTSPATLFGGTWERIARGRTLVGEGIVEDNNDNWCGKTKKGDWTAYAGKMGGEVTHTLTLNELPNPVWHSAAQDGGVQILFNEGVSYGIKTQGNNMNKAHNNLPPYLVVYIWKRTA